METLPTKSPDYDYRFMVLYFFGIIFVVAGHCNGGGLSLLYDWFPPYAFHLALFAFASGYFYKSQNEEKPFSYIWKKTKRILVPMYLWNIFYAFFTTAMHHLGFAMGGGITLANLTVEPIRTGHQFAYNMGGWFVVPLFLLQAVTVLIRYPLRKHETAGKEIIFFMISVALGIYGNHLGILGPTNAWSYVLFRFCYFLPFWSLGILYRRVLEKYDRLNNLAYFLILFGLQLIVILYCGRAPGYSAAWDSDFYEGPLMPLIAGMLGIAVWLRISAVLAPVLKNSRVVSLIAGNTFTIMINQFLGFMLIRTIFALISRYTPYFQDFDWEAYRTDILYNYLPAGTPHFELIYVLAGLAVPLIMQMGVKKIGEGLRRLSRVVS